MSPATQRRQRFKLDVTRKELINLAAGLQRKKRPLLRLDVTKRELIVLQDATDDYAGDTGAGAKGEDARRLRALQRKLHKLTGEEMPPTQAARRKSLRRLLKKHGAQ